MGRKQTDGTGIGDDRNIPKADASYRLSGVRLSFSLTDIIAETKGDSFVWLVQKEETEAA